MKKYMLCMLCTISSFWNTQDSQATNSNPHGLIMWDILTRLYPLLKDTFKKEYIDLNEKAMLYNSHDAKKELERIANLLEAEYIKNCMTQDLLRACSYCKENNDEACEKFNTKFIPLIFETLATVQKKFNNQNLQFSTNLIELKEKHRQAEEFEALLEEINSLADLEEEHRERTTD